MCALVLFFQTLQAHEFSVSASEGHQLVVRPLFGNDTFIKDINDVGFLDRAQSVCHGNGCSAFGGSIKGGLHHLLGLRVERRGCLIEEQDLGVAK